MERKCMTCEYFVVMNDKEKGECWRYPKQLGKENQPTTYVNEWCGEYIEKAKDKTSTQTEGV